MVNTILAKRVNHIVAKGDNPAWPKGSKSRGFSIMTGKAVIMLKNQDPNQGGIDYMTINMWSPFEANNFSDCKVINDCRPEHSQHPTHFFAQVRMVMKFRNQLDNGGAANYTTTHYAGTRASDKAEPNLHVWLWLKP